MLTLGEQDAKNAITQGHGVSLAHLEHFHALKKSGHTLAKTMQYGEFVAAKESGAIASDEGLKKV
jgi:hypothetical protein